MIYINLNVLEILLNYQLSYKNVSTISLLKLSLEFLRKKFSHSHLFLSDFVMMSYHFVFLLKVLEGCAPSECNIALLFIVFQSFKSNEITFFIKACDRSRECPKCQWSDGIQYQEKKRIFNPWTRYEPSVHRVCI